MVKLKAKLSNGSSKDATIEIHSPTLYIRPSADKEFPELYSNEGDELRVVEIALDLKAIDGVEWAAEKRIERIALAKLKKGKLITNIGKEVKATRMDIGAKFTTPSGDEVNLIRGRNLGYKFKGKVVTTKGLDQFKHFSTKGWGVSILGIIKHSGIIWDVFSLFNWALDPKSGDLPIPFVPNVIGMVLNKNWQDLDEAVDEKIKYMLQKAKEEGIDSVRNFVNSWKDYSGVKYRLLPISSNTASKILQGKFKTIEEVEMQEYNHPEEELNVKILYQIIDDPDWYVPKAIIETFFINTTLYE